jgi:hypothetical protein
MTNTIVAPIKGDMLILKLATQMMVREDLPPGEIIERIINIGGGDIIPYGFFIWDVKNEKIAYSPNFKSTLGFENEDPQQFMDSMRTSELQKFVHTIQENIRLKNKSFFSIDVKYLTNLGEIIDLLCVCTVIYAQNDKNFVICTHYQN